ncbi:MAG: efflux RND transporter permease subunit, partial [Bacteroidia bacterium]|nr:efflux RND transporter permease subunit [Bacteroidia bacterium]
MLNKIIDYSLRNKLMVFVGIFLLILVGAKQVYELPVDAVPDITDNQVQIITTSPALGAPDIERLITLPIELATNNLPGLKKNRSISRFGLSVVTLVFEENIDIYRARQQVSERLITVQNQIPKEYGTPELAPVTTGLGEIYQYVLHTQPGFENKYSLMELRTIQDWLVRRQLLGIKGVADIASFGGQLKQYEVSVNPYKLQASNTSIDEVFDALETNNQNSGGSYIEKGPNVLFIRTEGLLKTTEEIEQVCIKQLNNGTPLLIKDVAKVKMGYANRYGALTYNGKGEAVGGVVMMLKGENSKKVIERVKERVAEIQKTLPKGVVVEPYLDRTKMVNNAISTVLKNLIEGALIVIIVLILFLANWRAGFIVASIIPLSMLFAVCMMNLFGVSGNLMSLGALDFGLIVDGAVIIVEAVLHYLTKQAASSSFISTSKQEQDNMIKNISSKMMKSALFGQLIILLVYVPILSLQGIEGKMFKPMAQTVIFALMGAVILALTYVPVITSVLISIKPNAAHGWVEKGMERLERYYVSILKKAVNNGYKIMGTIALLFMVSVSVLMNRGGEFIPELPEGDFAVETRLLTGANLSTSINVCLEAQKILLKKFPNEVEKVVGKTGSSEIPTDPMPFEQTDLIIALKKRSDWKVAKTYNQLADSMQKELETITGVSFSFMYPVAMRFNELMTGARQDVVCKVFGDNLDTLVKYAGTMGNLFKNVKGAENIYVEPLNGIPQLVVNYSRPKIAEFGLDVNKINRSVNANFAGQYA